LGTNSMTIFYTPFNLLKPDPTFGDKLAHTAEEQI